MVGEQAVLVLVAEHRRHREVFALRDRIVLMVVTAGALHRQAHETVARGHHAVIDAVLSELFGDRTAFESHAMKPVEGGRDALVLRRRRQQVAGELFGQELVVGLVLIEGLEYPVAPRPGEHRLVARVAPGIGITRKIEPADRQMFTEARGSQHRVDALLVSVGGSVGEEGGDFFGGGGQSGQREGSAAEQGGAVGRRRGLQAGLGGLGGDERVERIADPGGIGHLGRRLSARTHEGPVRVILGALFDPAGQDVFLGRSQRTMQFRRRHDLVRVGRAHPFDHHALLGVTGYDRPVAALQFFRRSGEFIEAQTCLTTFVRIRAVTTVAAVGKDGADIAVEVDRIVRGRSQGERQNARKDKRRSTHGDETLNDADLFLSNRDWFGNSSFIYPFPYLLLLLQLRSFARSHSFGRMRV